MIDFGALDTDRLETMAAGGREVIECHRVLAKAGANIVGELLPRDGRFHEFDHCPPGDIYDTESHAQYYYHAHRDGEHGHFHTFLRSDGMPVDVRPVDQSTVPSEPPRDDSLSHLVAVSMDRHGLPIGLFTTNRWVTGEDWYAAEDVTAMVDRFRIDHANPSWPTNIWIGAMLQLFRPQITELLRERDAVVAGWRAHNPDLDVFEDRRFDLASSVAISVDDQIAAVAAALNGRA